MGILKSTTIRLTVMAAALLLAACASDGGGQKHDPSSSLCEPGTSASCQCPDGGGNGTATCLDDGSDYGACMGCGNSDGCSGDCDEAELKSYCMDDDLCFCQNRRWTFMRCSSVCAGEGGRALGCGDTGLGYDYCSCEALPDGDQVPDGDNVIPDGDQTPDGDQATDGDETLSCEGSCNPTTELSFCMQGDICLCDTNRWVFHDCESLCAREGKTAAGCGDIGQPYDYCICVKEDGDIGPDGDDTPDGDDAPDGDELPDGDQTPDGDDSPFVCQGACDPQTFAFTCSDEMNICYCDDDGQLAELDCDAACKSDYDGALECSFDADSGMDTCWCYTGECGRDSECEAMGKDYCIQDIVSDDMICVDRCGLSTCESGAPCVDVGRPDGCGVCGDFGNAATCQSPGSACGEGMYCSDFCDALVDAYCFETCIATPNSCRSGELCLDLTNDAGEVIDGACVWVGAYCPACGNGPEDGDIIMDGDQTSDGDLDPDGDQTPDGDAEPVNCEGMCDVETYAYQCVDDATLCTCDDMIGRLTPVDCDAACKDAGFPGVESCGFNSDSGMDVCWCTPRETPSCSGACDPDTYAYQCVDTETLCVCGEDSRLATVDCLSVCIDAGYDGLMECGYNSSTEMDICWCI